MKYALAIAIGVFGHYLLPNLLQIICTSHLFVNLLDYKYIQGIY